MPPRSKKKFPTKDARLNNGSIVQWSRRLRQRVSRVPVICGACKREHLPLAVNAIKPDFTGLHAECFREARRPKGDLPIGKHGSILHLDRIDPEDHRKRIATCGECGDEYSRMMPSRQVRADKALLEKIDGRCPKCAPRKRTGRIKLPLGSWIDFDDRIWITPPSGHPPYCKVAMECRGCFPETGVKKYVPLYKVGAYMRGTNKKNWHEFCRECEAARPRVTGVLKANGENPTTFYLPDDLDSPVRGVFGKCRHEFWTSRENALTNYRVYKNICPACRKDPESYRVRMQELEGHNNGHENGELMQKLLVDVKAVDFVWNQVRNPNLTLDENLALVTQVRVNRHIGGPQASKNLFSSRLTRHGVREMFPGAKSWYDDFVKEVVTKLMDGMSPEAIAMSLISHLESIRKAA